VVDVGAPAASAVAHSPQNFAVAAFSAPQLGQTSARRLAHSLQNLRPASFSVPQFEQTTQGLQSDLKDRAYNLGLVRGRVMPMIVA